MINYFQERFSGVDIRVRVKGGGHVAQIYAIRQAISKALVSYYQKCKYNHKTMFCNNSECCNIWIKHQKSQNLQSEYDWTSSRLFRKEAGKSPITSK
jgi:hypothetical protein